MKCEKSIISKYLQEMKRGKPGAGEDFYKYTEGLLYSYVLSVTRDQELSKDIKQDTYLKIIENINKFDETKDALAWIIEIAKNTALNFLRKNERDTNFLVESEEVNEVADKSEYPNIEEENLFDYITKILPELNYQIVILHLYNGFSQVEVASILKVPLTTVYWRYREALKTIKKYYERGVI